MALKCILDASLNGLLSPSFVPYPVYLSQWFDVITEVGEEQNIEISKDVLCKLLGILILSSKFNMSIDSMYKSKYFLVEKVAVTVQGQEISEVLS